MLETFESLIFFDELLFETLVFEAVAVELFEAFVELFDQALPIDI